MNIRPFRHIERRKSRKIKVGDVFVGGDAPALCNWSGEVPTPQKVAESILTVVAHRDNRDPEKFINAFEEFYKNE